MVLLFAWLVFGCSGPDVREMAEKLDELVALNVELADREANLRCALKVCPATVSILQPRPTVQFYFASNSI
eukprot:SAG22_NODE_634_length_8373_cov_4.731085_9_plen_71_part_00